MGRRIDAPGGVARHLRRTPEVFNGAADPRPISFNIWWRPKTLAPAGLTALFSNEMTGGPAVSLIHDSTGALRFYSGAYGTVDTAALNTLVSVDVWSMFTVTWAPGDGYVIYVNGVSRAAGTRTYTATTSPGNSVIGSLSGTTAFHAEGDYAEFAAWDSVLSAGQVASLYTGTESGLEATSVGSPAHYAKLLGSASPEPETVGGGDWTINGAVPASVAIASSPAHPTITAGGGSNKFRPYFITG